MFVPVFLKIYIFSIGTDGLPQIGSDFTEITEERNVVFGGFMGSKMIVFQMTPPSLSPLIISR